MLLTSNAFIQLYLCRSISTQVWDFWLPRISKALPLPDIYTSQFVQIESPKLVTTLIS